MLVSRRLLLYLRIQAVRGVCLAARQRSGVYSNRTRLRGPGSCRWPSTCSVLGPGARSVLTVPSAARPCVNGKADTGRSGAVAVILTVAAPCPARAKVSGRWGAAPLALLPNDQKQLELTAYWGGRRLPAS